MHSALAVAVDVAVAVIDELLTAAAVVVSYSHSAVQLARAIAVSINDLRLTIINET